VSDDVLKAYLDAYEETPWDALKYLISEANYGGRVTDEIDRRVLSGYLNQFFCEDALRVENFPLSSLDEYYVPKEGPLDSYREYIATLPVSDQPEAFGQHPNADISYMITDSSITLESCLSLQPKQQSAAGGGGGASATEALVDALIDDMLASTPPPFDHEALMRDKEDDPSPLHVTLFQEVERYNVLLANMLSTLKLLKKGIKGLVVMSADLDAIFDALANNKVPALYLKAYPSLKPLGSWTRDLTARLAQIRGWISGSYPGVYWLAGFTYPSCFLTAVLQTTARKNQIPIDTLGFEYQVMTQEEKDLEKEAPDEGVYVKDMYLEGAGWDMDNLCLCEPNPMELVVDMPIVHFLPAETKAGGDGKKEKKKEKKQGSYQCPLYMYPVRTGSRERPSFMIMVDLKSGAGDSDFWIKRGTALLLSLAT
jgi:dynein heavy chain